MADITSKDNKIIKLIRQLETKKIRDELSLFVIEGPNLIVEAISEHANITNILISEEFTKSEAETNKKLLKHFIESKIEFVTVEDKIFKSVADTENSQGIIGVVSKREYKDDLIAREKTFMVILDKLQDPGNIGTIIRTSQAAGVTCIGIIKGTGDIYSHKVVRATAGAIFKMPFIFFENEKQAIEKVKKSGMRMLCTTVTGGKKYFEEDLRVKVALVIGNEGKGASKEFIHAADGLITIPMPGGSESLNAAVAASIIIYEGVRQKLSGN
jgi:TrmH family RNA methyltransferase